MLENLLVPETKSINFLNQSRHGANEGLIELIAETSLATSTTKIWTKITQYIASCLLICGEKNETIDRIACVGATSDNLI